MQLTPKRCIISRKHCMRCRYDIRFEDIEEHGGHKDPARDHSTFAFQTKNGTTNWGFAKILPKPARRPLNPASCSFWRLVAFFVFLGFFFSPLFKGGSREGWDRSSVCLLPFLRCTWHWHAPRAHLSAAWQHNQWHPKQEAWLRQPNHRPTWPPSHVVDQRSHPRPHSASCALDEALGARHGFRGSQVGHSTQKAHFGLLAVALFLSVFGVLFLSFPSILPIFCLHPRKSYFQWGCIQSKQLENDSLDVVIVKCLCDIDFFQLKPIKP